MFSWLKTPLSRAEVAGSLIFVAGFGVLVARGLWHDPWVQAAANLTKHGVTFSEASTIFGDAFEVTIPDSAHSQGEARFLSLGLSAEARLLVVSYTERAGRIRIIHARVAAAKERNAYESG